MLPKLPFVYRHIVSLLTLAISAAASILGEEYVEHRLPSDVLTARRASRSRLPQTLLNYVLDTYHGYGQPSFSTVERNWLCISADDVLGLDFGFLGHDDFALSLLNHVVISKESLNFLERLIYSNAVLYARPYLDFEQALCTCLRTVRNVLGESVEGGTTLSRQFMTRCLTTCFLPSVIRDTAVSLGVDSGAVSPGFEANFGPLVAMLKQLITMQENVLAVPLIRFFYGTVRIPEDLRTVTRRLYEAAMLTGNQQAAALLVRFANYSADPALEDVLCRTVIKGYHDLVADQLPRLPQQLLQTLMPDLLSCASDERMVDVLHAYYVSIAPAPAAESACLFAASELCHCHNVRMGKYIMSKGTFSRLDSKLQLHHLAAIGMLRVFGEFGVDLYTSLMPLCAALQNKAYFILELILSGLELQSLIFPLPQGAADLRVLFPYALHVAVYAGSYKAARLLLQFGANPNLVVPHVSDGTPYSPVRAALVDLSLKLDTLFYEDESILYWDFPLTACKNPLLLILQLLQANGADMKRVLSNAGDTLESVIRTCEPALHRGRRNKKEIVEWMDNSQAFK